MDLSELIFMELDEQELDIELFDCGREDINDFFRHDARDYQNELFGKTYFSTIPLFFWGDWAWTSLLKATISELKSLNLLLVGSPQTRISPVAGISLLMRTTSQSSLTSIARMAWSFSSHLWSKSCHIGIGTPSKTVHFKRD